MEPRIISSFEEFAEAMSNLHDCPFDLDKAAFDKQAGTWIGKFYRPLWEDQGDSKGIKFLFWRWELPVVHAIVTVARVRDVQVMDDQDIERYTLNEIERTPDGIRIRSNEAMFIDIHLAEGIEATYDEQPLPGARAIYRGFFLVESGPKIEGAGLDEPGGSGQLRFPPTPRK